MVQLREKLLRAYHEGNLLQTAVESSYGAKESRKYIIEALVGLHNDGAIELIEQFKDLYNKPNSSTDFFLTRHLLEVALPVLNAPIDNVMTCVAHLAKEAGQDLAANTIFTSFIDFCVSDPSRPKQALDHIKESPDLWMDFITPVIVAGTRINLAQYFSEALHLASHENIEIRKRALFSIGQIQYQEQSNLLSQAIGCMESSVEHETDDHLLGNAIISTCRLCMANELLVEQGVKILDVALLKGGDYAFHAASEVFGLHLVKLPEPFLSVIIQHLPRINPSNRGTLDMIDYGVLKLLERDDPAQGIEFLESFLLTHSQSLSLEILDSVVHGIPKSSKLLNNLLTRWFLKGDRVLCNGICIIVKATHGEELNLEIDPNELASSDKIHLIYLAHKAIGYLFFKPIYSTSIIISLIRQTTNPETAQQLGSLLFDPLLLNFPGALRDFLSIRAGNEPELTKNAIQEAINFFDAYIEDLKSVGNIPEMHPAQDHKEAYSRYFHQLMSDSFKEAMKGSIINLCSKSVILYGRKSINYIQEPLGQSRRMEMVLSEHGTEIEVPRQEHIDPFGLDYMLRVFRAERLVDV